MSIKRSSRTLVATFVVASLTATPALASGGPMDRRSPDAKDAAAPAAVTTTADLRSPDAQDAAKATGGTAADLRVTSSLAGPPQSVGKTPLPGPPRFPENTTVLARPAAPVTAPSSADGFDVGDAFVGAAGSVVLLMSVAGGLAMSRRRRIATAA